MKYICQDCGQILDEEELENYSEKGEFWGGEFTEITKVCPKCKGCVDEWTLKCSCCGADIEETYIVTDDGLCYCRYCYSEERIG
ncbi:MAG: hypothetical protein NC085_03580 [Muribaculaceae bacterium]|nr:hypothetical protein [Alistipes senegalensis]MCM1478755.1 hypothetical protein [Muribaculaceae bacterium]